MKTARAFLFPLLMFWLLVPPAHAAPICRWVDADGRTHLADVVPERHAASASCTDSSQYAIDPDRVQQAQQQARVLRERAGLGNDPAAEPAAAASSTATRPRTNPAPTQGSTMRPAKGVDASTDCATWRQRYRESGECFGPYRTANGGVKSEAFEKCRPIPSPDLQCGPARSN